MTRTYSLAYLSSHRCTPAQAIGVAAQAGYPYVGLRLWPNAPGAPQQHLLGQPEALRETLAVQRDTGVGVFANLPRHFKVTRYHSLAIERETLPDCLEVTAWTEDGEIMGVRHKTLAVEGVQFHPESILTEHGHQMLRNFLEDAPR